MHNISWLASATLFMTSVSAFYPNNGNASPEEENGNILSSANTSGDLLDAQSPTIDIKKRRKTLDNRDNKYPASIASAPTLPDSMGINQDGQDYSYFSSIQIGSRGKDMWMLIDSGSANTWVFGSDCETHACTKHDTFGKSDSDTLSITSDEWSVSYGTGDVEGVVGSDKFAFAGYELELGFGLALNASDDFMTYPMDGILGLGRGASNKLRTPTLMEVMASKTLLKANMFGVHLSRSADGAIDGQITFGAPDTSKYSGDLSYTNSVSTDGMWEIPADGAGVDGQSLGLTGKTAIIDTGTSYILMPPADAKALHAEVPGSSNIGESFTIPCDTQLPIQFTFSGVSYDVLPKDYIGKPDKTGKMCASNIVGHQSFGADTWLLGDVFLKNVYAVFDFDKDRIGFGTKSANASPTGTATATSSTGSAVATSAGKVIPGSSSSSASASSAPQVTAMGSIESGSGSPMEGRARGLAAWSHLAILTICATIFLVISNS